MYNFGFRAHDLGVFSSPLELAEKVDSLIKKAPLQLAPSKSFPSVGEDVFSEDFARVCASSLNVSILGSYFNPVHPDPDERRKGLDIFKRYLALANSYGAEAVATETGSIDPDCGYHPGTGEKSTLSTFYTSLDEMLESAAKNNTRVAIEPVSTNHTISTLERMDDMIRRFDSDNLAIILDIANIAPIGGIAESDGAALVHPSPEALRNFLSAFFQIAGKRLVAVHVKNYGLDDRGTKICDLAADDGAVDWTVAASYICESYPDIPLLIEGSLKDSTSFFSLFKR